MNDTNHTQLADDDQATSSPLETGELEIRGRLTALEAWREQLEPAFSLVLVGMITMAATGVILTLALRKRLQA